MQLTFFTKDAAPSQGDVHVDSVIGAIHPFIALDVDGAICAKCGLTRSSHRSVVKGAGWDTPGPPPMDGAQCPDCGGTGSAGAWDPYGTQCSGCGGFGRLQQAEERANNNMATPVQPNLQHYMSPEDDATDPMKQGGNGTLVPNTSLPAGFHQPVNPSGPPNATKAASLGSSSSRPPRGQESGEVGEWPSQLSFNFVPRGQLLTGLNVQPASADKPRTQTNLRQDGPVFGPTNPGADPTTQLNPQWGGYDNPAPVDPDDLKHQFKQCPQCGVAVTGTEANCPNAWCGHDLEHDPTASYDAWTLSAP